MRILIISDTHGKIDGLEALLAKLEPFDLLIHCGDVCGDEERIRAMVSCPCYMVSGNNDYFSLLPREQIIEVLGHRIYVVHGHRQQIYYGLENLYWHALENKCDVVLFGHTHEPRLLEEKGLWFANPGSLTYPRQSGHKKTYMILEISQTGELTFSRNEV